MSASGRRRSASERLAALSFRTKAGLLGALFVSISVCIALGAAAGWFASQERIAERLQRRLADGALARDLADGSVEVQWRELATNLHMLEYVSLPLGPLPGAGGLAEVGPNLVVASASGRLDYLTADFRAGAVGMAAPMNWQGLRESGALDDPLFFRGGFRTHDVLAQARSDGAYDLYVSHLRYRSSGRCIEIVVSVTGVRSDAAGVAPLGEPWREVFVSGDCLPVSGGTIRFVGAQSGGRMAFVSPTRLLLTTGDYNYDGVSSDRTVSMDRASQLGKVLEINLETGDAHVIASGLRNPQGLAVARDGRIWLTDHGPQGGDELNLIVDGGNYGWPMATYGVNYGQPPENRWPLAAHAGAHEGDYVQPRFAFVPSIAISNLVQPDVEEFPRWSEHLLVSSLRARSFFLLKMEGDRVAYVEHIPFDQRMRDIATMRDGRIAMQSDAGYVTLLRNGDAAPGVQDVVTLTGLDALSTPLPEEAGSFDAGPVQRGAEVFLRVCVRCHSVGDESHVGPPVMSIVGRDVGAANGYGYSLALQEAQGEWTRARMRAFLDDPESVFPGSSMPPVPLSEQEFDDLFAFLEARTAAASGDGGY